MEGNKAEADQHVNTNISESTLPFCSSHAAQNMWCIEWKCQHFVFLLVLRYTSATFPLQHTLRHCLVRLFVCLFWHRLFAGFLPLVTSTQTHSHTSCCVRSCAHITSWWAFGTVRAVLSPFDPQNDVSNCILWLFVVVFPCQCSEATLQFNCAASVKRPPVSPSSPAPPSDPVA